MTLLIWLMSRLKRQKPREPGWYTANEPKWDPRADEKARTEIQRRLRARKEDQ